MTFKQSVCVPMIKPAEFPLDEFLREIRKIGYLAVEIWDRDAHFEALSENAKRHGLVVSSMSGHGTLQSGLNDAANHDRIEAELRTSIDIAAKHGVPGLICFSGNRNAGQSDFEGLITTAKGLRRIASYALEKKVSLNIEVLNSRVDHPMYQCDTVDWGVAMCQMVGSASVKMLFDVYHVQIMQGDLIRCIKRAAEHIGHFHTAGNPGRNDLDSEQEINYSAVSRAISGIGYTGYVGHEFKPKGDVIASLRQAYEACRG